ncbi:hypothetical protein GCM10022248_29140 [Nonomuraea soli]
MPRKCSRGLLAKLWVPLGSDGHRHHLWVSWAQLSHSDPRVIGGTDKTCRARPILAKISPA